MKSDKEVVVSDLNVSSKEQQLKHRFFNNQKPEPVPALPATTFKPDRNFSEFLEEMQNSLKSQPAGGMTQDLLKQQANIMQQQVDLLRQEQKSLQQVFLHMNRPASDDPKRLMAEMLAPLDKQIKEVKSYYEETKSTAKEISSQVNDLKKAIDENRVSMKLRKSVEDGMNKFTVKKQAFDGKVREAENLVSNFLLETEDNIGLATCKQGVEYLREQIEAVQKDAEKIELDMQARFKRIVQQAQKVKSIPQEVSNAPNFEGSEARIEKMLGGRVDYEEILWDINEMSTMKNKLIQEYKKMTPIYPKIINQVQIVTQVAEKRTALKKPAQLIPVPQSNARKTIKTKPSSLQNIIGQTQMVKPSSVRQPASRAASDKASDRASEKAPSIIDKDRKTELVNKNDSRATPRIESNYKPDLTNESFEKGRLNESYNEEGKNDEIKQMMRNKSPEPFQTKPGVCKGEQTKEITFNNIYPNIRNIETQEPPKPSIVEKTVDAVTEFFLNQILLQEKPKPKLSEPKPSKWLGVEEISELTKLGLYFDPLTIDKIGKEVLKSEINDLKSKKNLIQKNPKFESQDEKEESNYEDDFENSQEKNSETQEVVNNDSQNKARESLFNKISPKTPPQFYEQRFEGPEKSLNMPEPIHPTHPEAGIQNLLDPRILGRMSAASIQHYISALIDSGHIPRSQDTPSFLSRSPTPKTMPMATPQYKHTSDTTILEQKLPEEVREFFTSPIGGQIFSTIKENPSLSPQQVMESWVRKQGFNVNYPAKYDLPHKPTEKDVFGKPEPRGARIFDVDAEEKKIAEESSSVRKVFSIPVLEINRKSHSNPDECLVTDSEVSGLSQSGSIGSEVFNIENSEVLGGFMEYIKQARELEEGQVPGNADLSEGEVRMEEESLSSGEIPKGLLSKHLMVHAEDKHRLSGSGILSEEDFNVSDEEGEFDPNAIFKVE